MTDDVRVVPQEQWREQAQAAHDEGFRFFDVLTAVDLQDTGFEVVLRVWDVDRRTGRQLRTRCSRDDARLPSVVGVYAGAAWHERATAELFGISFEGHETAPLLLPEGFEGHPLRKDFVLAARVAKRWPGAKEPGESDADLGNRRRRLAPPGRPPGWGESDG
ncbi:MAG TPA: NADH-quinone oxidoreductase subunit C [Mycobacteriales bacterium]|nr:NADH-quinone oxidoreductase subunit C [Mycobacteriales bacterium]